MSYKVYDGAVYSATVDTHEEAIVSDVLANPGTDEAGIALRTGKNIVLVRELVAVLHEKRIIVRAYDSSGQAWLWDANTYAMAIWNKRGDVRTWLASNSGKTVAQMATALGVHEAIALALAEGLRAEGKAKLVAV